MANAELIDSLRNVYGEKADCYHCHSTMGCYGTACMEYLCHAAADALEADEKLIVELVKNIEHWKKDVIKLRSQLQKIKSQIYDLESMAKREYDDDHDNEYLEGYFDGLHQGAKLISTTLTIERGEQDER